MNTASTPSNSRLVLSLQYCFLLAAFFIPFSTALTNIFIVLSYAGFLALLFTDPKQARGWRTAPAMLALALLGLLIIAGSWSIAPGAEVLGALRKYSKLLIVPVAIALCAREPSLPARALRWSLAGTAVLATATYLVWLGWMPTSDWGWWSVGTTQDPSVFRNHITTGILLGFAACVSFIAASYATKTGARAACIAAGIYLTIPIVILGRGRTGYVSLFVGLVTLFLLRARLTPLRTLAGLGAIVMLFIGLYQVSPNFKARTDSLIAEVRTGDVHSANGLRMSYMRVGSKMATEHPLIGLGTGSFSEAYAPTARAIWPPGPNRPEKRHQPHSEFLLISVQLGLIGFSVYLAMLAALCRPALATRRFETDVLALLGAIYIVASTFNSLMWDPTEGYWFLLLSGCLYVQCARLAAQDTQAARSSVPAMPAGRCP